jgi:hypothetical protein
LHGVTANGEADGAEKPSGPCGPAGPEMTAHDSITTRPPGGHDPLASAGNRPPADSQNVNVTGGVEPGMSGGS